QASFNEVVSTLNGAVSFRLAEIRMEHDPATAVIHEMVVGIHKTHTGVAIQGSGLLKKILGQHPIVIVQDAHVPSTGHPKTVVEVADGADVALQLHVADPSIVKRTDDIFGAIGRGIVRDDQLEVIERL